MKKASHPARTGSEQIAQANPAQAARLIRRVCPHPPPLALVLGSGFHPVLDEVDDAVEIPFARLPGFASPTVPGHVGVMVMGALEGVPVLLLAGRAHFYEGYDLATVTFPIRVLAALGVESLVLTNAAGGIRPRLRPGDFMVVADHLNLMGANPLRGHFAAGTQTFVDLSRVYDPGLRRLLVRAGRAVGVRLRSGVYAAVSGPSYETPAEIRAFARLGADAIGMSTVPEAIVARAHGLRVVALSCITNLAAGRGPRTISHADVLRVGHRVRRQAGELLGAFVRLWAQDPPACGGDRRKGATHHASRITHHSLT